MIGIYCIEHVATGRKYIGKSRNIKYRLQSHKCGLTRPIRPKDCNRHLYAAVQKYGWDAFRTYVIEQFDTLDEAEIASAELRYIDAFDTTSRQNGFNLRRDSSTKMIVHDETLARMSEVSSGERNGNFGNKWTDEQKGRMSDIAKVRHASGKYGDEWKAKISKASSATWSDADKKNRMAESVSVAKQKFNFEQYTRTGEFVRAWGSIKEIVSENPTYKWQNIYSVCNGYKPTYMDHIWKKVLKDAHP